MDLKKQIDSEYSEIVSLNEQKGSVSQRDLVCGPIFEPIKNIYPTFEGYEEASDLGLGCGFPFLYADIKKDDTVIDLGCAAGVDSFIARKMVGNGGSVIGFDLTQKLIDRANAIVSKKGFKNIAFKKADIENLPLQDDTTDCVITNGVFSLLPDLEKAFAEVSRILKKGGTFCMADINRKSDYCDQSYENIKKFTGCLNGIRFKHDYLTRMVQAGFNQIEIVEERIIEIPDTLIQPTEFNKLLITTFKTHK